MESTVTFNGMLAGVSSWSETSIVTSVPSGATTGPLVVTVNGRASNDPTFTVIAPPPPSPDLVEKVKNPPVETMSGSSFSVVDSTSNHGNATADPSTTRFYLSFDTVKDRRDVLLVGTRAVPALAPGRGVSSGTTTVTVPRIAPGNYYLLACADDLNVVAESDERNNCVASAAVVVVR